MGELTSQITVVLRTQFVITVRKKDTLLKSAGELKKITEKGLGVIKVQDEHTSPAE